MRDIHEKIGNPLKFYNKPAEVESDNTLSIEEKIMLLTNWLDDINLRLTAESENMPASKDTRTYMRDVERLLHQYQNEHTDSQVTSKK